MAKSYDELRQAANIASAAAGRAHVGYGEEHDAASKAHQAAAKAATAEGKHDKAAQHIENAAVHAEQAHIRLEAKKAESLPGRHDAAHAAAVAKAKGDSIREAHKVAENTRREFEAKAPGKPTKASKLKAFAEAGAKPEAAAKEAGKAAQKASAKAKSSFRTEDHQAAQKAHEHAAAQHKAAIDALEASGRRAEASKLVKGLLNHQREAQVHRGVAEKAGAVKAPTAAAPASLPPIRPSKGSKLAAFAAEGAKKEAAVKGPLMKGKKGGTYRFTKSGKKVYTRG